MTRIADAEHQNDGQEGTLTQALLESRQRWRQFGALAADLVFEADVDGRLTFLAPDQVLGWAASDLLGQPAHTLLLDPDGPNPFAFTTPQNRRHVWLRNRIGTPVCVAVTITTMRDEAGSYRGARGVAVNVTEQERAQTATAAAIRRGEVLDRILAHMRQEVFAPRMMNAVLESITRALGSRGTAVLDLLCTDPDAILLHTAGDRPGPALIGLAAELAEADATTRTFTLPDGNEVLACQCSTRFGGRAALIVWRQPEARTWDADDLTLIGSVGGVIRIVLEHQSIQMELARQARTDPLTGLLNRRAFLEEASRRLDRLEREGHPGTLLFIDLDRLKQLNDRAGHDAGDAALLLTSTLLQRTFRPSDLVARLGGDEFAVWLDGADSLTAAERAEDLRVATPRELAHLTAGEPQQMSMSIGIATREPGTDETLDQVILRADKAMYEVKRNGRGHWRVSHLAALA